MVYHTQIANYFFEKHLGKKYREGNIKAWGEHHIQIGWSSPEIKEWCTNEWVPFKYRLPTDKQKVIDNQSIETFLDVTEKIFKHEIEVREEGNRLQKIFDDLEGEMLTDFNVEYIDLKGKDFYTDVHWFKSAIKIIFKGIIERKMHNKVTIRAKSSKNHDYIEIYIVHDESYSDRKLNAFQQETEDGDFEKLKNMLTSLCDWSIESKWDDGSYRINYLYPEGTNPTDKIDYTPKGFTHIMRFYK